MSKGNTITTQEASKRLGVTTKTLQRWDRQGKLVPVGRTETNRRLYLESQITALQGIKADVPTRIVVYCRVSSPSQRPDLKNQRKILETFCAAKGFTDVEYVEEIGGGMNMKRRKFLRTMDSVGRREVKVLVIAHKDRLARFGYEWFEHYCKNNGCELMVLNQESLSPEQEMIQDLMTILHCFSSRLYGLRNYKKKLAESLKQTKLKEEDE